MEYKNLTSASTWNWVCWRYIFLGKGAMFRIYAVKLLISVVVMFSTAQCFANTESEKAAAKQELVEILAIYKEHLVKQLEQTNGLIGESAVSSYSMFVELLKASETTEQDPLEHMQKILLTLIKLRAEEIERICEAKSYKPSKERCYKVVGDAHQYMKKYEHLQ
jgi:hypothetical protein